jgi:hypothetical protein
MPRKQEQIPWQGRQSGKSSAKWFGGPSETMHPMGNGASTGDGHTDRRGVIGAIRVVFRRGDR